MPTFRVDFKVKSDLVLAPGQADLVLAKGAVTLTLRNGKARLNDYSIDLVATMIGPHESMRGAMGDFQDLLGERLDWFTFVTQQRFQIIAPLLAVEWDPGPGKREYFQCNTNDERWPPAPDLQAEVGENVQRLLEVDLPPFVVAAARSFRVGARANAADEQFLFFWAALEMTVEGNKKHCQSACGLRCLPSPYDVRRLQRSAAPYTNGIGRDPPANH